MARKTRNERKKKATASSTSAASTGVGSVLRSYRPVIDGLLYALAIVGVIVTVHLWIQQEIVNFSQGCWGFNPPASGAGATSDCALVAQSDAGKLFGVSNVYWGIAFYIVVSLMGFLIGRASEEQVGSLKRVRAGLIAFGFFFSLYLVNYQMGLVNSGIIQETCKLCMTSAVIAASLFVLTLVDLFTSRQAPVGEEAQPRVAAQRLFTLLPVVAVVLMVGDYAYFTNKASSAKQSADVARTNAQAGTVQPVSGEDGELVCAYDDRVAPINNYAELINSFDYIVGPEDAPVTVVEFFDPNCPHCQSLHPVMKEIIDTYKDRVKFVYKPFPIRQYSIAQIEAMYVAKEQDKFPEMLDAQMALRETGGLSMDRIRSVASEIGMDVPLLNSRMRQQLYRNVVIDAQQKAAQAGVSTVPAVIVNGRFIGTRSQECISQFIEDAMPVQ